MAGTADVASIGALLGEPSRARMLAALMDGRALTATELALEGDVSPPTASSHLAKLRAAGLVAMTKQSRHRYFRIAGPEVASVIEALTALTNGDRRPPVRTGPRDEGLRYARICYDHLAGERAVRLFARMRSRGFIDGSEAAPELTVRGEKWLGALGIDAGELAGGRRPLCRACLDWSERRTHLAGAVGAALLDRMFTLRLARRQPGSRALSLSPRGEHFVERLELRCSGFRF